MPGQPAQHLGVLVAAVVVEDHVDHLAGRHGALDRVEEADELLVPVPRHAAADHPAVEDVEGGEQRGGAMALVVVRPGAGLARLQRQAGLGAVEGLDLFSSTDSTRLCAGGSTYSPTMSRSFSANAGSFERLKVRMRCGWRSCSAQIRCTELSEMPASLA